MAIKQVIEVAIKGTKNVVGGFKNILKGATGLISGFNNLKNQLISSVQPAFNALILSNEKLNQAIIRTQGNIAQNTTLFDEYGNEILGLGARIDATRGALSGALVQLEKDTRDLVGVTSEQVNESFNIVLENIGRFAGQSKEFTDPLESAQVLTRGLVGALGSLGLPLQQARQEFRALVSGDLNNRNAILAQTLRISKREFEIAKANGELVDFLNSRLEVFIRTNELQADSISGISSNVLDVAQVIARELGAPLLDPIIDNFRDFQNILFDNQEAVTKNLLPVFENLGKAIGQAGEVFVGFAEKVVLFFASPVVRDGLNFLVQRFRVLGLQLAELGEASIFGGRGIDANRIFNADEVLRNEDALKAAAKALEDTEAASNKVAIVGRALNRELSVGGAAAKEFDNNFQALIETEGKLQTELSQSVKLFKESGEAAIDLGTRTTGDALERINQILARGELTLQDQLSLIEFRSKLIDTEIKKNIELLEIEGQRFALLADTGQITEQAGALLAIDAKRVKVEEELFGIAQKRLQARVAEQLRQQELGDAEDVLLKRQIQAEKDIEAARTRGDERRVKDLEIVLEQTQSQLDAFNEDRIQAEVALAKQLEDLDREAQAKRIELERATAEAVRQVFQNELDEFDRFVNERNVLIERAGAIRESATIAQSELLIEAEAEIAARRLAQEEELQEERFQLALDSAARLQEIANQTPPSTEADQRKLLVQINESINDVLVSGNQLLTASIARARAVNEEREKLRQIEEETEKVRRDSALNTLTKELNLQSDALDRIETRARAVFDLEQARFDLLKAQADQRERERATEDALLQSQLELIAARQSGDREALAAATERTRQLAREAGISFKQFESERSIQNKLAKLQREREMERREDDERTLENLKLQFEQERASLVADERRQEIQNQIAIARAESRLAQEQAELAELQARQQATQETRAQITLALEQQKIELENAKIRLESIQQATLTAIDGELAIAQARGAAAKAEEEGRDPAEALEPFRQQLQADVGQGLDALDQQIAALDEQITQSKVQTEEERRRSELLEAQIQAKEASIAATQSELGFLREQVKEQERLNQLARENLAIRQRAAAIGTEFNDPRRFDDLAEREARRPPPPPPPEEASTPASSTGRNRRQLRSTAPTGQSLLADPNNIIRLPGMGGTADQSMTQATNAARQDVAMSNRDVVAALDRNTQANQSGTTITNNVNQVQLANRSLLVRTQGV